MPPVIALLNPKLMLKSVKALVLTTIFSLFLLSAFSQLRLSLVSGIASDVKKVIEDYPNRFINLMGEVIEQHPQSTDYACNFTVNGAEKAFITRYIAKKEICSWEALMLTTESFEKARQKFKALFNQLNNLSVDIGDSKNIRLKGVYQIPAEEKKFTSILFGFEPDKDNLKKLKVELSLEYRAPMEWKVKVMVYDREREDNERGAEKESDL